MWWQFLLLAVLLTAAAGLVLPAKSSPNYSWQSATLEGVGSPLGAYETYVASPENELPTSYVVFIPGNPGLAGYYSEFANGLRDRLGASVIVLGMVGHLSRTARSKLPRAERGRLYGLDDQLRHTVARAVAFQAAAGEAGVPFTLAGHSIGAWIALRAAQELSTAVPNQLPRATKRSSSAARPDRSPARPRPKNNLPEPRVLLITPFLEVPSSPALRFKRRLLHSPLLGGDSDVFEDPETQSISASDGGSSNSAASFAAGATPEVPAPSATFGTLLREPIGVIAALLSTIPRRARRVALWPEIKSFSPGYQAYTTQELLHRHAIRNVIFLGRTEFAFLDFPLDRQELQPLIVADRIRAAYVAGDEWAPLPLMDRLVEDTGLVAEEIESSPEEGIVMKHAFSVQPGSCDRVADWAARSIGEMVMGIRSPMK